MAKASSHLNHLGTVAVDAGPVAALVAGATMGTGLAKHGAFFTTNRVWLGTSTLRLNAGKADSAGLAAISAVIWVYS